MRFAQRQEDAEFEAELEQAQAEAMRAEANAVRAGARLAALRALNGYVSPMNSVTPAELAELVASDAPEEAGVTGDLPAREDTDDVGNLLRRDD
jgi:hypothetical protein